MSAKRIGNIDYDNISVEDLAQEVLRRARSIIQAAVTRYKAKGRDDIVDKIQKARIMARMIKLEEKLK